MGHPKIFNHGRIWIALFARFSVRLHFLVGPWANLTLKLSFTALFSPLKIILLQCFQFSVISII